MDEEKPSLAFIKALWLLVGSCCRAKEESFFVTS